MGPRIKVNKMRELILSAETFPSDGYGGKLLQEFHNQKFRARVFRTYSGCADGPSVTFVTTSKDIHLDLGTLSREALHWLAEVLDDECNPHGVGEPAVRKLLFTFPGRKGGLRSLLITCSRDPEDGLLMHLSPAY